MPIAEWRRRQQRARPTLKDLLLAPGPRFEMEIPDCISGAGDHRPSCSDVPARHKHRLRTAPSQAAPSPDHLAVRIAPDQLLVAAVTLGELQAGVENGRQQDTARAEIIENWIDSVAASYNVLPLDGGAFRCWARLMHGKPADPIADAMIGVTAAAHNLIVVTRNMLDFERLGVRALDPLG